MTFYETGMARMRPSPLSFEPNRGEKHRKWKLGRGQPELRPVHLERQAGGDLDADLRQSGEFCGTLDIYPGGLALALLDSLCQADAFAGVQQPRGLALSAWA